MNRLVCLGRISKPERKENFSFETRVAPLRTQPKLQPRFLTLSPMRLSHNGYLELILRAQRNAFHRGGRPQSRLFANIGIRIRLINLTFELNHGCSRSSQCCVTGMPCQSLSSKMARRQGATREHVPLRPATEKQRRRRSIFNSTLRAAVPWANFRVPPSASIAADAGASSLLQIRPNSSWRL